MSASMAPGSSTRPDLSAEPYRVMLVDDSAVVRGLLTRVFDADPEIVIVEKAGNGRDALDRLGRSDPEVLVLDVEMPVMDGLTALPKLLAAKPNLKIIMSSTLTRRNAEISLKALELGAADYLAKPTAAGQIAAGKGFAEEIVTRVKVLGAAARGNKAVPLRAKAVPVANGRLASRKDFVLRQAAIVAPEAIAIGSSTGGPQALIQVLSHLGRGLDQPVFITQHMPPMFTALLAENLGRASGQPSAEARDGEVVRAGHVYVAPGDHHMLVERKGSAIVVRLTKDAPENFCRPSVDPMLRSLSKVYGARLLVAILTGMGSDGARGAERVVAAGGAVIAQDEATSAVWGMPGAAAAAGVCSAVLPLAEIAPFIRKCALRSAA